MKKQKDSKILKVFRKILLHLFELAVVAAVCWWVLTYAPEQFKWPIVIIFVVMYLVYLVNSLIDDYLDLKGADFRI
jgi:cation transporter-like permease